MVLHDSFFFSINRSANATHTSLTTFSYSPLFHSTSTLLISLVGCSANFLCMIKLWLIISQYKQRKKDSNQDLPARDKSIHVLSHKKYHFLLILTWNDFLLCSLSAISCLDEKYYFQSLIARYQLCSAHILLWKFTLHFMPLLIIFVVFRYHYKLNKKFPLKHFNTTTWNQLLCTDLCIVVPCVLALAWSVDGLWLWGVTNIKDFVAPSIIDYEHNQTDDILEGSSMQTDFQRSNINIDDYYHDSLNMPDQKLICYLQINNNLNFTARLLHLIQADYVLLFVLHLFGKKDAACLAFESDGSTSVSHTG
jgi:hypothetical protein